MVVGMEFLLQNLVSWGMCAMFTISHFGLAWMPYVGPQCLALFLQGARQSWNVPLVFQTLWFQNGCGVRHDILIMCDGLLNACPTWYFFVRAWIERFTLFGQWESYSGSKGNFKFLLDDPNKSYHSNAQCICIEILCLWVRPDSFSIEFGITNVRCSVQFQWCLVKPFPWRTPLCHEWCR